jgi:lysophospholipase L1-like esterase
MPSSKARRITYVTLTNLAILVILLAVFEGIWGNWFSKNRLNTLYIRPNAAVWYDVANIYETGENPVLYKRDKYGLRGKYKDPAHIDILTMGGSTTDQKFIGEGLTWQDVMAKRFEESGKEISVVNAGVDGQSTYGHIKSFSLWFPQIPGLKPKYILFYVGINDLYVDPGLRYDNILVSETDLADILKDGSALYHLYKTVKGNIKSRVVQVGHDKVDFKKLNWTDAPLLKDHRDMLSQRLDAYESRLKELIRLCREREIKPIFVTQQTRHYKIEDGKIVGDSHKFVFGNSEINGVDYYHILKLINERTVRVGKEFGVPVVDLGNGLELQDEDYYDYAHNTPSGSRKIGDFLFKELDKTIN